MFVYLLLGCFMGAIDIMAITLPIVFAPLMALGLDPIWFGVIVNLAMLIGTITPPFGLAVFTVRAAAGPDVSVESIFRGSLPFFVGMLVALAILVAFPQISVFLPNMMMGK
jgi:TRAP-type C4-dicarboxylate transport system permease large subunit